MIQKKLYAVFINGDWHSDVEASTEDDALEIVLDRGVGYHIKETHVEPAVDHDWEPEENWHPKSLYGN